MIVGFFGYVAIVFGLAALVWGVCYLAGRDSQGLKSLGFLLAIGVVAGNRWVFPNVYTVNECGTVITEYMILPTSTPNNHPMSYGSHCYLINNTDEDLWVQTALYGNKTEQNSADEIISEIVPPKTDVELNAITMDYFFDYARREINTRDEGAIKYVVTCGEL